MQPTLAALAVIITSRSAAWNHVGGTIACKVKLGIIPGVNICFTLGKLYSRQTYDRYAHEHQAERYGISMTQWRCIITHYQLSQDFWVETLGILWVSGLTVGRKYLGVGR